jgi:integrase
MGVSPLSDWSNARKRMRDAIYANTGALPKPWNPHDVRRTVATRIAEALGEGGDKLVKRVRCHADREVTAIYNRYAYVKEMRHVLTQWANEHAHRCAQAGIGVSALLRQRYRKHQHEPILWQFNLLYGLP